MRHTLGVLAQALVLGICVVGSTSCESLPIGAYSSATDPLPANAQLVSAAQYADLQKSSGFYSITGKSIGEQRQAAAREDRDTDLLLLKFKQSHPQVGLLLPPLPREAGIQFNSDDTYTHSVDLNDGRRIEVKTLGPRWAKSNTRHVIETFPSRANQLSTYRMFYDGARDRDELRGVQLPDPATVQGDPKLYPAEKIQALNQDLADRIAQAPQLDQAPHDGLPQAPSCDQEEGAASGSDRSGNSESCAQQPLGLYARYNWPSKPYLTCVKDQAARGTCLAFATASALENLVGKYHGRFVNVSEQLIYQQGKITGLIREDFTDGLVNSTVLGAMSSNHWNIPFESTWEYNPSKKRQTNTSSKLYSHSCDGYTGHCSDSSHQMQVYCNDNAGYRYCGFLADAMPNAASGFSIADSSELWNFLSHSDTINRIVSATRLGLPVVLGFNVTPSWDAVSADGFVTYKSGESNRGGHAVHIVGSIDNATLALTMPLAPPGSGGGYMIIKNSWTNCWSDGGFVYVPYDYITAYGSSAESVSM